MRRGAQRSCARTQEHRDMIAVGAASGGRPARHAAPAWPARARATTRYARRRLGSRSRSWRRSPACCSSWSRAPPTWPRRCTGARCWRPRPPCWRSTSWRRRMRRGPASGTRGARARARQPGRRAPRARRARAPARAGCCSRSRHPPRPRWQRTACGCGSCRRSPRRARCWARPPRCAWPSTSTSCTPRASAGPRRPRASGAPWACSRARAATGRA